MRIGTSTIRRRALKAWEVAVWLPFARYLSARAGHGVDFVRSVYGPYLRNTPQDRTFELSTTGYGDFVANVIRNHDQEFVFLDIGASYGVFCLLASRHPLCRKAIAIEPVPQTYDTLIANIAFNRARKVEAIRAVISDRSSEILHLSYRKEHSGMSSVTDAEGRNTVSAPVLGADALSELVGGTCKPILAKIDVECSEVNVLSVLRQCPFFPALTDIVIELSEWNCGKENVRTTIRILEQEGFTEIGREGQPEHFDAHFQRPR